MAHKSVRKNCDERVLLSDASEAARLALDAPLLMNTLEAQANCNASMHVHDFCQTHPLACNVGINHHITNIHEGLFLERPLPVKHQWIHH